MKQPIVRFASRLASAALFLALAHSPATAVEGLPSPPSMRPAYSGSISATTARALLSGSGLSPDEVRRKLRDAGIPDDVIDAGTRQTAAADSAANARLLQPAPIEPPPGHEKLARVPEQAGATGVLAAEPFGFEIFHWAPTTFEPLSYGPVDADYPLGPGDELALTMWGDVQLAQTLPINREGFITLPDVGQVSVSGLTLDEARARLRATLARVYSGLRPASQRSTTYLSLSLGRLRSIQVFVLGQVVRPGSYTFSSVARVLYSMYAAGGPTREGSLREVRLIRDGRVLTVIDLYDVILGGSARNMPRLENGDVVFVPAAQRRVLLSGPVRRPAIYELHDGEQLRSLLRIAGGVLPEADLAHAQIDRIVPPAMRDSLRGQGRVALDVAIGDVIADSLHDVPIRDGDALSLFSLPDRRGNTVAIGGRGITRPGVYEFHPGMHIADLLAAAGGPTAVAYLERALITRTLPDSSRMALRFSPGKALGGDADENVPLAALDEVVISSRWDFKQSQPVTLHGLVRSPGVYELLDGMTLADLLMKAGGFTDDAFVVRAEIARVSRGGERVDTLEVAIDRDLTRAQAASRMVLEPHDAVFVRRDPEFIEQQFVVVTGEVRFPGAYSITRRDERVSDLVTRCGGLTAYAYPRGATFLRSGGARLAIDLPGALHSTRSPDNLVLLRGDTLVVPRFTPTVKIDGAVLAPVTALWQQGRGIGFYVTQASGYRPEADRHAVVVVAPNGKVSRGGQPEPGSRILVPLRENLEPHDHLKDFATLMSVMASVATTYFLVRQGTK